MKRPLVASPTCIASRGPDDSAPCKSTPERADHPASYVPPPRKARKVAMEAVVVPTINPTSVGRPLSL
jgi:hypothetical protein